MFLFILRLSLCFLCRVVDLIYETVVDPLPREHSLLVLVRPFQQDFLGRCSEDAEELALC